MKHQRDRSPLAVSAAVSPAETRLEAVLTVAEAAAFLRVSEDSVLRHRHELGGFRIGRAVRFRHDRLEAYTAAKGEPTAAVSEALASRQVGPLSPAQRKAWRRQLRAAVRS